MDSENFAHTQAGCLKLATSAGAMWNAYHNAYLIQQRRLEQLGPLFSRRTVFHAFARRLVSAWRHQANTELNQLFCTLERLNILRLAMLDIAELPDVADFDAQREARLVYELAELAKLLDGEMSRNYLEGFNMVDETEIIEANPWERQVYAPNELAALLN